MENRLDTMTQDELDKLRIEISLDNDDFDYVEVYDSNLLVFYEYIVDKATMDNYDKYMGQRLYLSDARYEVCIDAECYNRNNGRVHDGTELTANARYLIDRINKILSKACLRKSLLINFEGS